MHNTKLPETNKAAVWLRENWLMPALSLLGAVKLQQTGTGTESLATSIGQPLNNWPRMQLRNRRLSSRLSTAPQSTSGLTLNHDNLASKRPASGPNYNRELFQSILLQLLLLVVATIAGRSTVPMVECSDTATTHAEPISWSFGGWAPVDGSPRKGANHSSNGYSSAQSLPTTPYNRMVHASNSPELHKRAHHEQPMLRMLPQKPVLVDQQLPHSRPTGYSHRAPAPIMREHPLGPSAPGWLMNRPGGPNEGHRKQMMQSYTRPQYVMGPAGASYFQKQHEQHMHQHQQRIQQIHGNGPRQNQVNPQEPHKMFAPYQFRPWHQPAPIQQQQHTDKHRHEPMLYMHPQHQLSMQGDRIPVLEVSAHHNGTGSSRPKPSRYPDLVQLSEPPTSSSEGALERDMKYRSVLSKVEAGEIQLPANSIHDIKQQQEKLQRQLDKNSYLTIPVAVETDGDRVLTADDISEIEKHVINVLPNLKTADKIAELADAHVATAGNQSSQTYVHLGPVTQMVSQPAPSTTTTRTTSTSTRYQQQQQQEPRQQTTLQQQPPNESHYTVANGESFPSFSQDDIRASTKAGLTEQTHYLVVSEPAQEIGVLGDLADLNLKNDLLHQFRYEPTRSNPSSKQQHQQLKSSTPPMSQSAYSFRPRNRAPFQGRQSAHQPSRSTTTTTTSTGGRREPTSSTRTIMGGKKVSDVMRLLIRTTPVPMTSPMHAPSLEPERVDAIQLIAGGPHENKPMVVEAHELVNHTPDNGIDYNSGRTSPSASQNEHQNEQQQQQQQPTNHSANHYEAQPEHLPQQPSSYPDRENQQQGAVIEYVSINDPQTLDQAYEVSGRPGVYMEPVEPHNNIKQLAYEAPLSQDGQTTTGSSSQAPSSDTNSAHAVWSPSIANEHQQHLELLSEHANRQLDLPATAGYNFFTNHADQQVQQQQPSQDSPQEPQQQLSQYHEQHQQELSTTKSYHHKDGDWPRTRAGGRQPNPDAQYDGQIPKAAGQDQEQQQQVEQQDTLSPKGQSEEAAAYIQQQHENLLQQTTTSDMNHLLDSNPSTASTAPNQNNSLASHNGANTLSDVYQQQQQLDYMTASTPPISGEQGMEEDEQMDGRSKHSTRSFVGGAQLNHATPSQSEAQSYGDPEQPYTVEAPPHYSYMKLDRNKQQGHLRRQQAQHQAERAQLLKQLNDSASGINKSLTGYSQPEQQQTLLPPADEAPNNSPTLEESQPSVGDRELTGYQEDQGRSLQDSLSLGGSSGDQQSLLADSNEDTNELFSDDDKAKQQHQRARKEPVYQVYQAYYAPKHHKPLPGYVRLSIRQFNELFRDAEIKYVGGGKNATTSATTAAAALASLVSDAHL